MEPRQVVSQDEILDAIAAVYPLGAGPGAGVGAGRPVASTPTGAGDVGVIPSVTKPFCGDCDRVRLTAEGQLRTVPLRDSTSSTCGPSCGSGGGDDDLAAEIVRAVGTKWAGTRDRGGSTVHPAEAGA